MVVVVVVVVVVGVVVVMYFARRWNGGTVEVGGCVFRSDRTKKKVRERVRETGDGETAWVGFWGVWGRPARESIMKHPSSPTI